MQMFNEFGQCFQVVMTKIEKLMDDWNEMKNMLDEQLLKILDALYAGCTGDMTSKIGNTPHHKTKTHHATPSPKTPLEPMKTG